MRLEAAKRRNRAIRAIGFFAVVCTRQLGASRLFRIDRLLLSVVAIGACSQGEQAGTALVESQSLDGTYQEIFLEPAEEVGVDPFLDDVQLGPIPDQDQLDGSRTADIGDEAGGIASLQGDTANLFAGDPNRDACDKDQLIAALSEDAALGRAWGSVHGLSPPEIVGFIENLTPVFLTNDTRVTNHGYRSGDFVARNATLQAGTAVLIDARGVPRVRCVCGNPLVEPTPVAEAATVGEPWAGYDQGDVTVIVPAAAAFDEITLIDITTGSSYQAPLGVASPISGEVETGTDAAAYVRRVLLDQNPEELHATLVIENFETYEPEAFDDSTLLPAMAELRQLETAFGPLQVTPNTAFEDTSLEPEEAGPGCLLGDFEHCSVLLLDSSGTVIAEVFIDYVGDGVTGLIVRPSSTPADGRVDSSDQQSPASVSESITAALSDQNLDRMWDLYHHSVRSGVTEQEWKSCVSPSLALLDAVGGFETRFTTEQTDLDHDPVQVHGTLYVRLGTEEITDRVTMEVVEEDGLWWFLRRVGEVEECLP